MCYDLTPSMRRPVIVKAVFLPFFSSSFANLFAFSRAASVAFFPSALFRERFSLGASWAYSFQQVLWSEQGRAKLEKLALAPWASRRRQDLLELLDRIDPTIEELTATVEQEARSGLR
jgi:hypothetical protein